MHLGSLSRGGRESISHGGRDMGQRKLTLRNKKQSAHVPAPARLPPTINPAPHLPPRWDPPPGAGRKRGGASARRAACAASVVAWARSATAALEPACGAETNQNIPLPAPPCSKNSPVLAFLGQGPAHPASPGENGARREKLRNHPQNSRGLVFRRGGS
jgi:hypothetical protein